MQQSSSSMTECCDCCSLCQSSCANSPAELLASRLVCLLSCAKSRVWALPCSRGGQAANHPSSAGHIDGASGAESQEEAELPAGGEAHPEPQRAPLQICSAQRAAQVWAARRQARLPVRQVRVMAYHALLVSIQHWTCQCVYHSHHPLTSANRSSKFCLLNAQRDVAGLRESCLTSFG